MQEIMKKLTVSDRLIHSLIQSATAFEIYIRLVCLKYSLFGTGCL